MSHESFFTHLNNLSSKNNMPFEYASNKMCSCKLTMEFKPITFKLLNTCNVNFPLNDELKDPLGVLEMTYLSSNCLAGVIR